MNRLDAMLDSHPLPSWRPLAWPVMLLLAAALGWANFARLDEVSVIPGEVVPHGKVKVVQHLEGGIIQTIDVYEGDTVKAGDTLVLLDLATGGVNRNELQARLDAQVLLKARLTAEATGTSLVLPDEEAERQPDQAAAQRKAYAARREELEATIGVLHEQIVQREQEVKELEARQKAASSNLRLSRRRFEMSRGLVSQGLTSKMDHLELEAEMERLSGELDTLEPAIPRARAAVEESRRRGAEEQVSFRREAQEELSRVEEALARVRALLAEATEQGLRAEIKSPIDGVVKNMRYYTVGGVVKPGEPIMEIVPTGENLVIQGKLNPTDRGFVAAGQKAVVKVSTYDYARYGGLDGEVVRVAPDSSTDENGVPYYRVIVQTEKTYLGDAEGKLPILPGMQATIDIHTGEKSVMEYLIRPVLKLKTEAFRER